MNRPTKKQIDTLIWFLSLILSVAYIILGNKLVSKDLNIFQNSDAGAAQAKITQILSVNDSSYSLSGSSNFASRDIIFSCKLLDGEHKGKEVIAYQTLDQITYQIREVEEGDKILVFNYPNPELATEWVFSEYVRTDPLVWFGILFLLLVLILGRIKGLKTIVSLVLTVAAVFFVFIPSVINGYNIYISATVTCVYITVMTLLIISGVNKKSLATIIGCIFGVAVAALLTVVMDRFLKLSGYVDEHSIYIELLNPDQPIDLKAIIFGSIIIGAMGAVMDVAMDIASSLYEIRRHMQRVSFMKLIKSGLAIGRDIMGTMANTLVLAYIGSSMSTVLLLITYTASMTELLNREQIIVEFLQALTGSAAILLTIPLTTLVCALLYVPSSRREAERKERPLPKY